MPFETLPTSSVPAETAPNVEKPKKHIDIRQGFMEAAMVEAAKKEFQSLHEQVLIRRPELTRALSPEMHDTLVREYQNVLFGGEIQKSEIPSWLEQRLSTLDCQLRYWKKERK